MEIYNGRTIKFNPAKPKPTIKQATNLKQTQVKGKFKSEIDFGIVRDNS